MLSKDYLHFTQYIYLNKIYLNSASWIGWLVYNLRNNLEAIYITELGLIPFLVHREFGVMIFFLFTTLNILQIINQVKKIPAPIFCPVLVILLKYSKSIHFFVLLFGETILSRQIIIFIWKHKIPASSVCITLFPIELAFLFTSMCVLSPDLTLSFLCWLCDIVRHQELLPVMQIQLCLTNRPTI